MNKRHLFALAAVLTIVAGVLFLYKVIAVGLPIFPEEKRDSWEIETRIRFEAKDKEIKAAIYTPQNENGFSVLQQHFVAPGYGLTQDRHGTNTVAVMAKRKASGGQVLYAKFVVNQAQTDDVTSTTGARPAEHGLDDAELAAARALIARFQERSADRQTFVPLIIDALTTKTPDGSAAILLGTNPTRAHIARRIVSVLSADGIPARVVNGLELGESRRRAQLSRWIEVAIGDKWIVFGPEAKRQGLPRNALVWWRGGDALVQVSDDARVTVNIAVERLQPSALANVLAMRRADVQGLMAYSLYSLPLQTQQVYRLLLLVPIGIFLLVILRNVVGVKTFGTFMPVLIALAFRETQLVWGLILFTAVVGAGLILRAYLEQLKLLLVPRLAAVLICVVLIMAILSILSHKMGLYKGLSVALFPMVIMTMTIERMSIIWDERGPAEAFKQAAGSLIVAVLCYLVMNIPLLEHLLFAFPELLLVILAATLLLGRYTGYRLTELPRFRVLAGIGR